MFRSRLLLLLLLVAFPAIPGLAQRPESLYKAGLRAESKGNVDIAYEAFKLAHEKRPADPRYLAAYLKARLYASSEHIQRGQNLRDAYKLQDALTEFQRAAEIDLSNFAAQQEIRRTAELIRKRDAALAQPAQTKLETSSLEKAAALAAGPVSLEMVSSEPVSLHLIAPTDVVYKTICKLAGINVLIDPEFKPQKITVELHDVSLRDALSMVAMQSKTFWRPLSSNSILVSGDSSGRRKDLEQTVMRTFYLKIASTPADLQQAASTLKGILDISRIQITPEQRALTVRGTPDQMVLAQRLLQDVDKPRAELLIDIAVLEISRGHMRTLGVVPPTTVTATIQPSAGSSGAAGTAGFTLSSLSPFTANNVLVSIPNISIRLESRHELVESPRAAMQPSSELDLAAEI